MIGCCPLEESSSHRRFYEMPGSEGNIGKLAATSIQSIYGLLAIFPMLGLSLLLGGVTSGEFARVLLALLLVLLFSLAMGLAVSLRANPERIQRRSADMF